MPGKRNLYSDFFVIIFVSWTLRKWRYDRPTDNRQEVRLETTRLQPHVAQCRCLRGLRASNCRRLQDQRINPAT